MVVPMSDDPEHLTPGQRRTLAARQARRRGRLDRLAAELRGHDYVVISPEDRDAIERADARAQGLVGIGGHTIVKGVS